MFKFDLSLENLKRGLSNPFQIVDELVLHHGYRIPSTIYNMKRGIGTNIYTRDWDLLIILDCCRVDALREVAPEYDFIEDVGSLKSVGGSTPEWTSATFNPRHIEEIKKTAYVSGTAQLRGILDEKLPAQNSVLDAHIAYSLLQYYDTVDISDLLHADYAFKCRSNEDDGTEAFGGHPKGKTPPRYITDRGVSVARDLNPDRLILHYMQPHGPYVAQAIGKNRDLLARERRPLRYLRDTGDLETVWDMYLDEIRYALDDVEIALNNIDAEKVVITADHGEAFGEYGIYGHTIGSLHPEVRNVPWATTTASDSGTYTPTLDPPTGATAEEDESTEEILEALGYKI